MPRSRSPQRRHSSLTHTLGSHLAHTGLDMSIAGKANAPEQSPFRGAHRTRMIARGHWVPCTRPARRSHWETRHPRTLGEKRCSVEPAHPDRRPGNCRSPDRNPPHCTWSVEAAAALQRRQSSPGGPVRWMLGCRRPGSANREGARRRVGRREGTLGTRVHLDAR